MVLSADSSDSMNGVHSMMHNVFAPASTGKSFVELALVTSEQCTHLRGIQTMS